MAQMEEPLPSKFNALSSNPSIMHTHTHTHTHTKETKHNLLESLGCSKGSAKRKVYDSMPSKISNISNK
jgi:hypothetical protein